MNSRPKILVVDDDPINIRVIVSALHGTYDVFTALNGHDAIRHVKEHLPDLILLDVLMPDLSGFDVCKIIKADASFADIPVIFLTALDTLEGELQGLELGGIDYLGKPVHIELLKLRIHNHITLREHNELVRKQRDLLARQKDELAQIIAVRDEQDRRLLETEATVRENSRRMASLLNVSQYPFTNEQDFLDYALNEVIALTFSAIGYIYFYSEQEQQFTLNTWSKNVMKECSVLEQPTTYDLTNTGVWGEAVRQRKAILLNDYQAQHPLKKGTPEGHVLLKRFLTVPLQIDGTIVAVIGVANKESDYSDSDVMQLTLFMDTVWKITAHKRAEGEKEALEKQFQQTQKLESLGVLAGGIAHDFNNILTIIIGHCALAKMDCESAENHIAPIEKAAGRAADLCSQMLTYAGKAQFVLTLVNMTMLVEEMLKMLKTTIHQNAVIKPSLAANIPLITGDASQIRQVVMNLIINAAEAIGDAQGEIHVSLSTTEVEAHQTEQDYLGKFIAVGRYACMKVSDSGCGMDDETKKRLFEPFYTTKFTGRGLGMSAVLGIITAHGGALQLSSQVGAGKTFTVYLPIQNVESPLNESQQRDAVPPWQGSGTILLVEDETQIKVIAKIMLNKMGFAVIEASNGTEALEAYQKSAADITMVVTDLGMPVMDGYELFRTLKEHNPDLPIIISSGFGDAAIASRIPHKETAGIISKPYNFIQMREILKKITGELEVCG
jgi:CheY-like chemotaxis protein